MWTILILNPLLIGFAVNGVTQHGDKQNDDCIDEDDDDRENIENEYNPWKAWKQDALLYDEIFPEASTTTGNAKSERNKVFILLSKAIRVSSVNYFLNYHLFSKIYKHLLISFFTGGEYIPVTLGRLPLEAFRRVCETRLQILQSSTNHRHNKP